MAAAAWLRFFFIVGSGDQKSSSGSYTAASGTETVPTIPPAA